MDVRTITLTIMGPFKKDDKTSVSLFTFADANATSTTHLDIRFYSNITLISVLYADHLPLVSV
jgi:hypothetical protein